MMEGLREALQFITDLKEDALEPKIVEIAEKTYCNQSLVRYGKEDLAEAITASTLTSIVDYIKQKSDEMRESSILHIVNPTIVELYSGLLEEKRRETLFRSKAIVNEFEFDKWYDQERFLIELQANFIKNEDLEKIMMVAGNIQSGTTANYNDDGISQKTTIRSGVANNSDVIVPNPVKLMPYRTFNELKQPESAYVFRIRDEQGAPSFKLIEADGGIWKNEAMLSIKNYLQTELAEEIEKYNITIIA